MRSFQKISVDENGDYINLFANSIALFLIKYGLFGLYIYKFPTCHNDLEIRSLFI